MTLRIAFAALFSALAVHVLLTILPGADVAERVLYVSIELGAIALIAARSVRRPRNRAGWGLIAFALSFGVAGDMCRMAGHERLADLLFLAMFFGSCAALAVLLRDRIRPFPAW